MKKNILIISNVKNIVLKSCDRNSFFKDVANDKIYTVPRRE